MFKFVSFVPSCLMLFVVSESVMANKVEDETSSSKDFVEVAITPQFQNSLNSGGNTANYEFDFLGLQTLHRSAGAFGDTRLAWWVIRNETIGNTPTGEFSDDAGLLWNTNDGDAPDPSNFLGVLVIEQYFIDEALKVSAGKVYPGNDLAVSDYTGDDRGTFMSEVIASDIAGRYFNAIGLGSVVTYRQNNWFVTGVVSDATAEDDFIDVSSFKDGHFLYAVELGFSPDNEAGNSVVTVTPYSIDATAEQKKETGVVLAYTIEYGKDAEYANFARYTWRNGGDGKTQTANAHGLKTDNAGFIGWAWNRPFSRENQQLSAALMYGSATDYQRQQGMNNQYGVESYWRFSPTPWFNISPSLQLLKNADDELETVVGLRFKLHYGI